ncbi:MAG: hypothetical protein H6656_13250 [Ardenticatenaceae bacterium]|nr:hypothetical protein [Ardenticatenaceae bacterium]
MEAGEHLVGSAAARASARAVLADHACILDEATANVVTLASAHQEALERLLQGRTR